MYHPVDVHVGKKLKALRTLRGLSQTSVAQKLGLSFQQIQKYEIGSNRISASRLFELAQVLDVEPSYFFPEFGAKSEALSDDWLKAVSLLAKLSQKEQQLILEKVTEITTQTVV